MEVYFGMRGLTLVVRLVGELDEHSAEIVRRKMDAAFADTVFSDVVLDLSRLSFMDSTGIGVVIGRYKILRKMNKQLCVENPSPTVDKIFRMSGMYEIVKKTNF